MHVIRDRPDSQPGDAERFTGTVWIDIVASVEPPSRMHVFSVHFAPGARTAWHHHPNGQVLHVTEGRGRVQQRDRPLEEIRAGDTVVTPAGEWHWHGAAPSSYMAHLAIQQAGEDGTDALWGDHVTDEEYLR